MNGSVNSPISLHPDNSRYFIYQWKPTVLITSSEDYGCILNLDFNVDVYLDELQRRGLNHDRVFSGIYREIPDVSFNVEGNAVAPLTERYCCPWARSSRPGALDGGNLFDLDRWDEHYFIRLKDYMDKANEKGIIVEFVFFCTFYFCYFGEDLWNICPLNASNNINETEDVSAKDVHSLKNKRILARMDEMVVKLVHELNHYDNLFFEICNEPWNDGISMEWQQHIAELIVSTEMNLPKQHLISMDVDCGYQRISKPINHISIYNFHYALAQTAKDNQELGFPIGLNETGFWGQDDYTYRSQAWEFMLSGGALYNNIDYSFSPGFEDGTFRYGPGQPGGGSVELRNQLGYLRKFLESMEFIRMKPDRSALVRMFANNATIYMMSEEGKSYAAYIRTDSNVELSLSIPAGEYDTVSLDPVSGEEVIVQQLLHSGGLFCMEIRNMSGRDVAFSLVRRGFWNSDLC